MKKHTYEEKLSEILKLRQFEKYEDNRANARHPNFKEELRVGDKLRELKAQNKIDNALFDRMKPVKGLSSQPARLYGLAKVHKDVIPLHPVLSMPGSVYHPIAEVVKEWLNVVPECQINLRRKYLIP